jgi:hypothetical protein
MTKHYWFRRKLYGWGWTPVTWQGWLIIVIYVALITLLSITINENSSVKEILLTFISPIALLTTILIYICYKTGEKPKWQWGRSEDKK